MGADHGRSGPELSAENVVNETGLGTKKEAANQSFDGYRREVTDLDDIRVPEGTTDEPYSDVPLSAILGGDRSR